MDITNIFSSSVKKILKFFLICFIFVALYDCTKISAASDIRVGLEKLYSGKEIITIYNSSLKIGYCVKDSFHSELLLKSNNGFTFETVSSDYYSENRYYSSYSAAYKALQNYLLDGDKPEMVLCGQKKWRLYFKKDRLHNDTKLEKVKSSELIKLCFGSKQILINASESGAYPQFKAVSGDGLVQMGSRKYRGRIEIGKYGKNSLTAVNIVNIESYLKGVVTCEMNSSWENEALKAQAVCARSYAVAKCGFKADSSIKSPYVINDTDASQVYGGADRETSAAIKAVNTTTGKILYSNGKPIPAYYSSTSGGATEFSSDIWGSNSYNFIGVFDEYETDPEQKPWTVSYTFDEFYNLLTSKGYSIGKNITDIYPEVISGSERVSRLKIKYNGGSISIDGSKLRSLFKLPSTKFKTVLNTSEELYGIYVINSENETEEHATNELYVISKDGKTDKITDETNQLIIISDNNMTNYPIDKIPKNCISFIGMGSGHGIGLSQSGANGMAAKGFTYEEIIYYYFNNVQIKGFNQ